MALASSTAEHETWKNIVTEVGKSVSKESEELSLMDLLENKKLIYERFNALNETGDKFFNYNDFENAFKTEPSRISEAFLDVVKSNSKQEKELAEAWSKKHLGEKINELSESMQELNTDGWETDEELREVVFLDDEHFRYKRLKGRGEFQSRRFSSRKIGQQRKDFGSRNKGQSPRKRDKNWKPIPNKFKTRFSNRKRDFEKFKKTKNFVVKGQRNDKSHVNMICVESEAFEDLLRMSGELIEDMAEFQDHFDVLAQSEEETAEEIDGDIAYLSGNKLQNFNAQSNLNFRSVITSEEENEDEMKDYEECPTFSSDLFRMNSNKDKILRNGIMLNIVVKKKPHFFNLIFDTGASRSLFPKSLVDLLEDKIKIESCKVRNAKIAGGGVLKLQQIKISGKIPSEWLPIEFEQALVCENASNNVILIGQNDLVKNNFKLVCKDSAIEALEICGQDVVGQVVDVELFGLHTPKKKRRRRQRKTKTDQSKESITTEPVNAEGIPVNDSCTVKIGNKSFKKEFTKSKSASSFVIDQPIETKLARWNYPVGYKEWEDHIDQLASDLARKNTAHEVSFNPAGDVEETAEIKLLIKKLKDSVEKHKTLFNGDAGNVTDPRFLVRAEINGQLSGKSVPNYYGTMAEHHLLACTQKLDREIALGILGKLDDDQVPKNILPIFPVVKPGDRDAMMPGSADEICVNVSKIRLVADASRGANLATTFAATQSDNVKRILQKVAPYTVNGLVGSLDISMMFFSFNLEGKLHPFFCVEHPLMGLWAYKRLPMGWIASPSATRFFLMEILYKFRNNIERYLDDIIVYGEDPETFFKVVDGLLSTLLFYGFRLKGGKMSLLAHGLKLLGKFIERGKIGADAHTVEKIVLFDTTRIVTKRQLKAYLGLINYLQEYMPYRADLVNPVTQAAAGNLSDHVVWDTNLNHAVDCLKRAVSKCVQIMPVDPNKDLILVVDSSLVATGAFIYQEGENGQKNFIKIFSKKRTSHDSKFDASSCITELQGIVIAANAALPEIEACKGKLKIYTDSASVEKLFKRVKAGKIPSADRRINTQFANLMHLNYQIIYISNKTLPILMADYINRQPHLSKDCKGCRLCDLIKVPDIFKTDESDRVLLCKMISENSSFEPDSEPLESFDSFYRMFFEEEESFANLRADKYDNNPCKAWNFIKQKDEFDFELRSLFSFKIGVDVELNLDMFMKDKIKLSQIQNSCPDIRRAIQLYDEDPSKMGHATKKFARTRTLLETHSAYLDMDNVLKLKAFDKIREITKIILPEGALPQVCAAAHKTFWLFREVTFYHGNKAEVPFCKRQRGHPR